MSEATFTCPRCFHEIALRSDVRFCPHCGLPDAHDAASDTAPLDLRSAGGKTYRILDRFAVGSICNLYRCGLTVGGREVQGVFKIARDVRANDWISNEADVLTHLREGDVAGTHAPFLPQVIESVSLTEYRSEPPRRANVLRFHDEIRSPADELYTLEELLAAHPGGLDARDVAWIWRRLLSVLAFAHSRGVIHGAVLPMHVLIEPRDHKLVLVDWCAAVRRDAGNRRAFSIISGGHRAWYRREIALTDPPAPALDVALGARCMIELLGGDPIGEEFPASVDPAIRRHFERCLNSLTGKGPGDAAKMLEDFDRLIETLWGPRTFRVLEMPPRATRT